MKQHRAASDRNALPIRTVLTELLPERGVLLEIASGSGQHAAYFANAFPGIRWHPSDVDPSALASIAAHADEAGSGNLEPAILLDTTSDPWPVSGPFDAILCVNMIHIAPWSAAEGLLRGASQHLSAHGQLITYGPYRFDGAFTAPSNAAFDDSLRSRDPSWGVRDVSDLGALAARLGLRLDRVIDMPANNHVLTFIRG